MKKLALIVIGVIAIGLVSLIGLAMFHQKPFDQKPAEKSARSSEPVAAEEVNVFSPKPDAVIQSPVTIKGEARGSWYFEGIFPIFILDESGTIIGNGTAEAKGDSMTTEFVPFEATVEFAVPSSEIGSITLARDTPSGLPEDEAQIVVVPVSF